MIYRENDCAVFYRTRDALGELSNMRAGMPILYQREWRSSEALYQALRYPGETAIHDAINAQPNAFLAKRKAHEFKDRTRADWYDGMSVDLMERVVKLKTAQHYTIMCATLEMTGNRDIVEKSTKDDFWGAKPDGNGGLVGDNVLGLLWMIVRDLVQRDEFDGNVVLPL